MLSHYFGVFFMKQLTLMLVFLVIGFSGLASAATLSWKDIQPKSTITDDDGPVLAIQYGFGNSTAPFSHSYSFLTDDPSTSSSVYMNELLDEFITISSITLDGIAMTFDNATQRWFGTSVPGASEHFIKLSGDTSLRAQQYQIYVDSTNGIGEIPIPGAVWLFGSALFGLIGLGRKKEI
jgi:hypothetical protein